MRLLSEVIAFQSHALFEHALVAACVQKFISRLGAGIYIFEIVFIVQLNSPRCVRAPISIRFMDVSIGGRARTPRRMIHGQIICRNEARCLLNATSWLIPRQTHCCVCCFIRFIVNRPVPRTKYALTRSQTGNPRDQALIYALILGGIKSQVKQTRAG